MATEREATTTGRTGRRPGPTRTREAVLAAARRAFAANGYDGTSLRAVAREAGVDPALVSRFYGGKAGLFAAALDIPVQPDALVVAVLEDGIDGLGERLVGGLLGLWGDPRAHDALLTLLRGAMTHEDAAGLLREFVTREVLAKIATVAAPDRPQLRATLVGSQVVGLLVARYVIRVEPLASEDPRLLAAVIGPNIQRYLTGELPAGGS
jgi:AcrR family transcriptional regulator